MIGATLIGPRPVGAASGATASHAATTNAVSAPVEYFESDPDPQNRSGGRRPLGYGRTDGHDPRQIRHAYGIDSITFNGVAGDGTGTTIAIVDAYNDPNIANDLHQFDLAYDLPDPPSFTVVSQTGSTTSLPATNDSWATEIALDVEWSHAVAPGAKIVLVEANSDSNSDLYKAVNYARNYPNVVTVSMSWGGSEDSSETSDDGYFTTPSGHTGVTFLVASGDSVRRPSTPRVRPM